MEIDYSTYDERNDDPMDGSSTRNEIQYDTTTTGYYKSFRVTKTDPLIYIQLCDSMCFKFHNRWDSYTGERLEIDNDGPLCFHPDSLIRYFYLHRLDNLWHEPVDETRGHYEGYFGDGVGAGEQFHVNSRGDAPEKYLFRLPIIDCYLTPQHQKSIITMGPKLTNVEINEIDKCANAYHGNTYSQMFRQKRPSLSYMKQLYDVAIDKNVGEYANRNAVNLLRRL